LGIGQPLDGHVAALNGLRSFPVQPVRDFANGLKVTFLALVEKYGGAADAVI
jgi:hypothetical protein